MAKYSIKEIKDLLDMGFTHEQIARMQGEGDNKDAEEKTEVVDKFAKFAPTLVDENGNYIWRAKKGSKEKGYATHMKEYIAAQLTGVTYWQGAFREDFTKGGKKISVAVDVFHDGRHAKVAKESMAEYREHFVYVGKENNEEE